MGAMVRSNPRLDGGVHTPGESAGGTDSDEKPTIAKHESGVLAAARLIDIVPRLTIDVTHADESEPDRIVHDGETCRIGTHSSNDVVLRDPSVSRFHCRLSFIDDHWRLEDMGSLNGTVLNGVRVRDADLGDDAVLRVGYSSLRTRECEGTERSVPSAASFGALIGKSVAMRKLFPFLEKVAASEINVLIEGESGTGKELVATEIAQRGPRSDRSFVVVDCGAVSPTLIESELFGHVRGAFTGAERERIGAFETATGGTIFLDEIGELPLALQPKFLRALESHEIRRVGETKPRKVDVRVIAATNRDLEREVNRGRFREDLYFRLAVMKVHVPPLREHLEDLPLLIRGFLTTLGMLDRLHLFPPHVLEQLTAHEWPGNVRELRNYVERTVVLDEPMLALQRERSPGADVDITVPFKLAKDAFVDGFERRYVSALLDAADGNVSRAARSGAMDRMYLHRLIQKHDLRAGVKTGK
jgi:transcriptional regulator with GAF, ATPase, and Fis domain